ncbi:TIGR02679 family protein [Paenibacillus allorhizosphaerae]|uniref:TIGR02679 family protein n=1 Tax=Paenibacillus allorhizosphaerae TaxID=2849866 RepID=A0ABN7TR45_9BACL|nr:TIGR02679 family protein [Paenibacillus allorhizosphaerae]CAG7651675.1 hypothetical protein PAECIP111802_05023 [Paenibacillus allorhizosphaerae]
MDIEKAIAFFKKNAAGYERLFEEMIKKYRSYGRIAGEITLEILKPEERRAISEFFRSVDEPKEPYKMKLVKFEKMLANSVFDGITLKELLDAYAGEELISNKQAREDKRSQQQLFFDRLTTAAANANVQAVLAQPPRSYIRLYEEDEHKAKTILSLVLEALAALPLHGYERLPMFAEKITKDPHAFDPDVWGKYLIDGLKLLFDAPEEDESELLVAAGILKDDIHNFVSASGLISNFSFWQIASEEGCILNVPLREAIKLTFAAPAHGKDVFVVENSGVFSALLDRMKNGPMPPLLCLHGQPKESSLILLDRLAESGVTIHYAGDFDPESLMICERLWQRYGEHFTLWHMDRISYDTCLSLVELSTRRLSMLKNVQMPDLHEVKERMLEAGRAGYQERLVPRLLKDLNNEREVL